NGAWVVRAGRGGPRRALRRRPGKPPRGVRHRPGSLGNAEVVGLARRVHRCLRRGAGHQLRAHRGGRMSKVLAVAGWCALALAAVALVGDDPTAAIALVALSAAWEALSILLERKGEE